MDARRPALLALAWSVAACDPAQAPDAGAPDAGARDAGTEARDAGDAGLDAGPPPLRDDAVSPPWRWDEQAARLIEREALEAALADRGYALPDGAWVYAARVGDGVGQPAYELFEAGGGAFDTGFWPASTIKLLAAVAAVEFVGTHGLSGAATMTWDTGYSNELSAIYDDAIRLSHNDDYDRLLRVAGLDWIDDTFLTAERGFPSVILGSSYGGLPIVEVTGLTMTEGDATVYVPPRTARGDHGRNDTDLFDLVEGLRRVLQHEEIPAAHRFALSDFDRAAITDALCGSSVKYFAPGARAVLGDDASVCNKYGYVPSAECLDHALIESADGTRRYLLAAAIPAIACEATLSSLAENVLAALETIGPRTPLALDAGIPIVVQLDDLGSDGATRRVRLTIDAPGADALDLAIDREDAVPLDGASRFAYEAAFDAGGDRLVVVRARAAGVELGYRALRVRVPDP